MHSKKKKKRRALDLQEKERRKPLILRGGETTTIEGGRVSRMSSGEDEGYRGKSSRYEKGGDAFGTKDPLKRGRGKKKVLSFFQVRRRERLSYSRGKEKKGIHHSFSDKKDIKMLGTGRKKGERRAQQIVCRGGKGDDFCL